MEIFGDWRDLRSALDAADPGFAARPEEERRRLWALLEAVLRAYPPLHPTCQGCGRDVPAAAAYRCADCGGTYCSGCVRAHFGDAGRRAEAGRELAALLGPEELRALLSALPDGPGAAARAGRIRALLGALRG